MKKVFFIVAFLAINLSSFAQTEKGKIIMSGTSDLGLSSTTTKFEYDGESYSDDIKSTQFNITPSLGYFVIDNLALGLSIDFESTKQKVSSDSYTSNSLLFGPFARYYVGSGNIKPYIQGDFLFGNQKSKYDYSGVNMSGESKNNVSAWDLGVGLGFFLNDFISLDLGLGYGSITMSDGDNSKDKTIISGVALSGGFAIFF
ncbi:outer membrane beta-barrel protein [Carboxylicivirga caseinilyticus]|uniref:outer membrane beta-barrel protein n=1 Tax=Carboxylicivirga caseinilyticus TaxID=3417572 RepID=UPI003D33F2C3|nr:porin family protein [Marinilabiliaceae bacterium A049]